MTGRPDDAVACTAISKRCGECDQPPVWVGSLPAGAEGLDIAWACDDHLPQLVDFIRQRDLDAKLHVFEASRTCRAGDRGVPCGAAGDYVVVRDGGTAVITVCERHMRAWRPADARGGRGA